ncbi:family 3 encapsulin nanocompartment shell protein [Streptomyces spectabilis]|uniref:family 3 encapsulin nanocompartment shell protein n=1 Tax=Streptomyces spectabilis TaxID=68270 RepID=UPI0033E6869F
MRTAQSMAAARDSRQLLDDPSLQAHSPGEEFAQAASLDRGGDDFALSFRSYLPTAFPLFAERPRYTVRQLLNAATVRDRGKAVPYIEETRPDAAAHAASGVSYEATLEAAFGPGLAAADFTDLTVSLPVPDGLLAHPRLLAAFIDRRLLVRVGVRENQTLLHGSADGVVPGLLNLPGLRRVSTERDLLGQLTEAAALVEETGGSCDGVVAHPSLYWQAVESGLLDRVATAGLRISRTRIGWEKVDS